MEKNEESINRLKISSCYLTRYQSNSVRRGGLDRWLYSNGTCVNMKEKKKA
jgi:hypothetical protein